MNEIKSKVEEVISTFRTRDPYYIAKRSDINVMYMDLGDIKGFYRSCLGNKFIVVNENLSEFMSVMVLAHELGHYFLHDGDEFIDIRDNFLNATLRFELEANKFAAYLLINGRDDELTYYTENEYEERIYKNLYKLALE